LRHQVHHSITATNTDIKVGVKETSMLKTILLMENFQWDDPAKAPELWKAQDPPMLTLVSLKLMLLTDGSSIQSH
jgi:hypothetical protein